MRRFVLPLLLTMILILAACAPAQTSANPPSGASQTDPQLAAVPTEPSQAAAGSLTRIDQQGAVTVEVTPLDLVNPSDQLEFNIALETHSVDLIMDLATLATLTSDTGITLQATLWDAPRGGHHLTGKLIFPLTSDGKSILDGASTLTLTILNLDAPARVLEWGLK